MKALLATVGLSLVLVSSSSAQVDLRSPQNVAARLYDDCVKSHLQATDQLPKQKSELGAFVTQLNENCTIWTVVWIYPLMGEDMSTWDDTKVMRFDQFTKISLQRNLLAYQEARR